MKSLHDRLDTLVRRFQINGALQSVSPYGDGHINDTYLACYRGRHTSFPLLHQRINQQVFRNPPELMDNVVRVTEHVRRKLAESGDRQLARRSLTVIRARDGKPYVRDEAGEFWRTYLFIENSKTCQVIERAEQAFQVGHMFGRFQSLLRDLPGPRLHETIPQFHNLRRRFENFRTALREDSLGRAAAAQPEIGFALGHEVLADAFLQVPGAEPLPERITHNDTKLNNVLLDAQTEDALCVIDLDTVMPGSILFDFGDMVRTSTSRSHEDELDLSKVVLVPELFAALARGFLSDTRAFLTGDERRRLVLSGKAITYEMGLRFLTDYLQGDVYYKVHRPGHNLDRCRTQFKLIESIAAQEEGLNRLLTAVSF